MVAVPGDHGEGIAVHDNRLYQLSWQSGIVRVYRIPDLQFVQEFRHEGEGWGLTAGPDGLIMSDGSSTLQVRDDMFHLRGTIRVRSNRVRVTLLNDLAYAQGFIYSNVWGQPYICEIEYPVGRLTRIVDCSALVAAAAPTDPNAVFNGIAYNPDAGTFFVTGKFWPRLFEIEFGC